jgi:hypothetical protein
MMLSNAVRVVAQAQSARVSSAPQTQKSASPATPLAHRRALLLGTTLALTGVVARPASAAILDDLGYVRRPAVVAARPPAELGRERLRGRR